ncbi:hypothetical protein [Spiroplasma cantharicola]|uniref:Uncharacterized protein n=1 Tax=Spiroplasma cantharicola TaxID=362837 RepID=A0A0M4JSF9_9MOLU|nr:hypothetical protein [Spiroplasma cantharicola]ALD66309.1 hypothetical protein SCANT_v1c03990 [Spiroplasma cantharicola]
MKRIIMLWTLLISLFFSFTVSTSEFVKNNITNNNYLKSIKKLNESEQISYKSLIESKSNYMYYGRFLKYYYANSIKISDSDIEIIKNTLKLNGIQTTIYESLFIQNMLASTIMPSIYGASSDAEFFAESFSKWLNTEDILKNKSWEVTNNFYINLLPEIIKQGGTINGTYEDSFTISQKFISLVENSQNKIFYDTTLDSKPTNSLNLKYSNSSIIWENNQQTLDYFLSQLRLETGSLIYLNQNQKDVLRNLASSWMNDSYTPASQTSIEEFNSFNENYYQSFDNLDKTLAAASKDKNNYSGVWLSHIFNNLEEVYLKKTPNSLGVDYEKWSTNDTEKLKEITLKTYNSLYNIIKNDIWVSNILVALILSPDFPLKNNDGSEMNEGTMGYTSTSYYIDKQNNFVSTAYSYIVITGPSLTFKEFNSQYKQGFWSTPYKFSVVVHEIGHALDGFGSKLNMYRNNNYSKTLDYKEFYKGDVFGEYVAQDNTWSILVIILAGSTTAAVLIITYVVLRKKSSKKNIEKVE